jgi:hypothetical protein
MQVIIKGSKKALTVRLGTAVNGVQGDPVDLTGITEITTCFLQSDNTELMLSKTGGQITIIGSPFLGKLSIYLSAANSALLQAVDTATLQLSLVYGTDDPILIQIPTAYAVVDSTC